MQEGLNALHIATNNKKESLSDGEAAVLKMLRMKIGNQEATKQVNRPVA